MLFLKNLLRFGNVIQVFPGGSVKESDSTVPGDRLQEPVATPVGQLGMLTCYDLRFAEVALRLRRQGAELISYPSAFTVATGAAHWEVLLRARAIETQSYVLAAAQSGQHYPAEVDSSTGKILPARVSYGNAMIVDPWGKVVTQPPNLDRPSFALANIDLDYLKKLRQEMPLWEQRRTDIYGMI